MEHWQPKEFIDFVKPSDTSDNIVVSPSIFIALPDIADYYNVDIPKIQKMGWTNYN